MPKDFAGYICIVDYNLSRVNDVQTMTQYARNKYGLNSILFRHRPTDVDYSLADIVFNLDPLEPDFANLAIKSLGGLAFQIKAVVPFSDNSVVSGSRLAEVLELKTDSSYLARRAFSKQEYREAERLNVNSREMGRLTVPKSQRITNTEELAAFVADCGLTILKPSCEGNNRGVLRLSPNDSMPTAWREVEAYIAGGLIAEEYIAFPNECSFDGIGPLNFITKKLSENSRYPVEFGQIVPAPIDLNTQVCIQDAGQIANRLCGQKLGPFHNEIKYDPRQMRAAVIEPNRRPAGMKIWHLAERVYGLNFFHLWIDQLVTGNLPTALPKPKRVAGIRMLPAPLSGTLRFPTRSSQMTHKLMARVVEAFYRDGQGLRSMPRVFDFQWNLHSTARVHSVPMDNSQFLAQICMESDDLNSNLEADMNRFADIWKQHMSLWIQPTEEIANGVAI